MNDKKKIELLRRSYNQLERQFFKLRKENDKLYDLLATKEREAIRAKDETKRPAKSIQDTNLLACNE